MTEKRFTDPGSCQPGPLSFLPDPIPLILPFGGISLIAGAAGTGKTAFLATLLRDLQAGKIIFGHQPSLIPAVGIIAGDRGWERGAGYWFARAGFADIPHYAVVDDKLFSPRSLRRKFDRTNCLLNFIDLLKLPPGGVVAVDPIGLFLGGNLIDYDSCAVACLEIRAGLRDRGLSLIGTAHSGKMKSDKKNRYLRLQDSILGSAALFGFGDTMMYLAAPDELGKPYYAFLWHPHEAPAEMFYLERDDRGLFASYSGSLGGVNCTRVLALFPEGGSEITFAALLELAAQIPLSRATVARVLDTLVEEERIEKVRRGVYRLVVATV